jgi:hypothetical protein
MSDPSADRSAATPEAERWRDTEVSPDERVAGLLRRMSLREKVA